MNIVRSNGFKEFKKKIGQENHFLITILIGLDGVRKGTVIKDESFRTSWNPRSVIDSSERSRDFAIKAALAWLVDCIDAYFLSTYNKPKLIQNSRFESEFCSADQSVFRRYNVFKTHVDHLPEIETAFVDLLINWRNRLIHSNAKNPKQSIA